MARFAGAIGYATGETETAPGVWTEGVVERSYFGDVLRPARQLENEQKVNNDLSVRNSISVVADAYANEHFFAIRYVVWQGVRWSVPDVTVEPPRLILRLGGVYNGPTPGPA